MATTPVTKTFSQLLADWAAAVQGSCSTLVYFVVGSILRAVAQAQAGVVLWLQGMVLQVLVSTRLSTAVASGNTAAVQSFLADFGMALIPAKQSTGSETFGRFTATNAAFIANGSVIQTADGTQSFTVIADQTQSAYSQADDGYVIPANVSTITATVQAVNGGTQGNIIAGALTILQTGISGVDYCSNAAAFDNGTDQETLPAALTRFQNTFQSLSLGTTAAIERAVTGYNSTLQCTVQLTPTQFPAVTVTVDDGSGNIPAGTLAGAAAAAAAVIADGISYAVVAATKLTANVSATITTAAGYTHSTVCAAVDTALANDIAGLGLGNPLEFYNLPAIILAVPGVTGITSLSLNSGTSNMTPTPQQTIKPGTIATS